MKFVYLRRLLFAFFLSPLFLLTNAQSGCPSVNAGNDVALPCGTNCANLNATFFQSGNTTTYGVSSIPYTPFSYTSGTPILVNIDDIWGSVINLPFTFCFFGNAYNQVVVGANGLISFDTAEAGQYCVWDITASGTLPTTNIYGNCIMGPYHDIDPSLGGTIKYQIIGTAPCRIFVISYYQVPMFNSDNILSTCSGMDATHQIAIYETTNAIEIYIAHKDACPDQGGLFGLSGWNDGLAIEGIQNATQTVAYTVPGRNNTAWTANNDAWRFTPNGPSIVTVDWFQGATQIGTGTTVNVCPGSNSTYTAQATYLPCAGGTPVIVTDNVNVTLAGALQAGIDSSHNVTCFSANNGVAYAHATTTNAGLTYGWAGGPNTLTYSGLAPGIYVFTASDASLCVRSDTVVIAQPTQLTANVPNASQTNCSGSGTGTLVEASSGGTYPYLYNWNSVPAQVDSVLDNVIAGTYTVTVTDTKGCTVTASGTLTISAGGNNVALGNPVITNISCFGGNDGSITASASGGSGVYTFNWNPIQTGSTISNLISGQYNVTVDDGAGCTASGSYNVTQPTQLVINSPNITNIGCGGIAAGSITANVSGGTPTYTYNWIQQSNSQAYSGQLINNLPVDNYNLTVTDFNNCTATANYSITAAIPLTFTQSQTDVSCFGGSDGTTTITVTTGTLPYNYDWNGAGSSSNSTLNGVGAGPVNVTITDANCSATATFNLAQPTQIVITKMGQTDVSCYGGSDGTITVSATGGSGSGYIFTWNLNPSQTGTTATNLLAGPATVICTDANFCTASQTYTINEPSQLTTTLQATDASCYQAPNGSIVANPSGGTLPYSYLWSDPDNQTTKTANGLLAGTYTCVVTDGMGCSASANDVVNEPADMIINTSVTAVRCIGDKNGTISVSATGGTSPYNYSATLDGANFVFATNGVIIGLGIGTYTVIVSDNNGCTKTVLVTVPNATIDNFTTSTDSTSCYGSDYNDGAVHISATSIQNSPYQFSLDNSIPQFSGDFFNVSAGAHTITATNFNGCISTIPAVVLQPLPIIVDVVPDTVILPLGDVQQVQVTYLNASNVTYTWTPELGLSCTDCPNPLVSPFFRQDYVVTISMINGTSTCYGSATLHADVLDPLPVFVPNSFTPNGDGNNDVFQIYGQGIKTIDLKIFNRWGELVYQSNNQFEGWDGTYKGQLQLPQVFTYAVKIVFLDDKKTNKKGTVTLVR